MVNSSKSKKSIFNNYSLSKIIEFIKPDFVHVLSGGKIIKTGDITLSRELEKTGYFNIKKMKINILKIYKKYSKNFHQRKEAIYQKFRDF